MAKQDAGESIDYDEYAERVKKLMDKHVVGVEVREPEGVYEVGKMGQKQNPKEWSEDKTRNETDIIKTRIAKKIEQELRDDPYAQEAFSILLRQAIREAEALFDHPLKQYMLFREFEEKVETRKLDELPDSFNGNCHAQAYYGVFKKMIPSGFQNLQEGQQDWINISFTVDELVSVAVAENSINPQNIEAEIRKKLLPLIFKKCKAIGEGMNQAKGIVELIVQITRVGLNAV